MFWWQGQQLIWSVLQPPYYSIGGVISPPFSISIGQHCSTSQTNHCMGVKHCQPWPLSMYSMCMCVAWAPCLFLCPPHPSIGSATCLNNGSDCHLPWNVYSHLLTWEHAVTILYTEEIWTADNKEKEELLHCWAPCMVSNAKCVTGHKIKLVCLSDMMYGSVAPALWESLFEWESCGSVVSSALIWSQLMTSVFMIPRDEMKAFTITLTHLSHLCSHDQSL